MGTGWLRLAFGLAVVTTPLAAWWLIRDLSEANGDDYVARAPDIAGWVVTTVGALTLLVLVVSLAALARGVSHGQLDRRWINVLVLLMLAGAFVAYTGRVATAAVTGANIGFGLCFIFGGPILIGLVGGAIWSSVSIRRRPASKAL